MKRVLIIDAPPLFREFLKEKLSHEKVNVEIAHIKRDAFTKLVSSLPDLLIIDLSVSIREIIDFLTKKNEDPNASRIPVFMTGPIIAQDQISLLSQFNVVKYFNKPIKFDVFFESIGKVLKTGFSIDTTPCILEIHLNNDIIFIEIAQGLNREKISLLKYRISEIIEQNDITTPKIILMMTDLSLSFVDGANLEFLLDNVIADTRIQKKNIKILSLDSFTKELVRGHSQYDGIEVVTNLSNILPALIDNTESSNIADLITEKVLTPTEDISPATVEMKFYSDSGVLDSSDKKINDNPHIAIVDDDQVTRTILQNTFKQINAEISLFDSGSEFLMATNKHIFDLIILDIYMPGLSGFDILKTLHSKQYKTPIIIYSNATSKESVVQALSLGAKSYLVKPLKPEALLQKAIEVLHSRI
ncbi:MAG TPA: response regulator [Treponemataceae bacterium]|jgi:DNA-binding response OmpR family regulator|nr:response regulator [Treponemataceae bacterium]